MNTRLTIALCALAACAAGASGQTMQFSLSASQTEVSESNPSITIEVLASWDSDPAAVGFASAEFDTLGVSHWETGTITDYGGYFYLPDVFGDDEGELQPNNDILGTTPWQLPPFFNVGFIDDNPVSLLTIDWETDDFTPRQVCVEISPLYGYVYLDDFGTSMELNVIGGTLCFDVVDDWCPGDFNNDGNKDTQDMLAFLSAWNAGDRRADWNQDGLIDTRDVLHFINDWLTLC